MLIPVLLHKDKNTGYGVTVPDVPGCYSFGDSIRDALRNTKTAILFHFDALTASDEKVKIALTPIEVLVKDPALEPNGIWAMVDLNDGPPDMTAERTNISLPKCVKEKIDEFVKDNNETRSGFLCRVALEAISKAEKAKNIT